MAGDGVGGWGNAGGGMTRPASSRRMRLVRLAGVVGMTAGAVGVLWVAANAIHSVAVGISCMVADAVGVLCMTADAIVGSLDVEVGR
ncbi:hypothetical protein EV121DRAFT_265855 [Schizophyllum commune]